MRFSGLLAGAAVAGAALLSAPSLSPTPLVVCPQARVRHGRLAMAAAAAPEEEGDEAAREVGSDLGWGEVFQEGEVDELDMAELADRISSVKDKAELQARLLALDQAWVLVFDADTDDEAVYSMEMHGEGEGAQVVLAFESDAEARTYAESLHEEAYESIASVQASPRRSPALHVHAPVHVHLHLHLHVGMWACGMCMYVHVLVAALAVVDL